MAWDHFLRKVESQTYVAGQKEGLLQGGPGKINKCSQQEMSIATIRSKNDLSLS